MKRFLTISTLLLVFVTLVSFGARVLRADAAAAVMIPVLRYIWRDL